MVNKIIEEIKKMDKEIEDLRHQKAQAEALLATIVKQIGAIEINFDEVFKSDIKKVKIKNDNDPKTLKIFYEFENKMEYKINEDQVNQILNTEPVKIKETDVVNDILLTEQERIYQARKILDSRKGVEK
jgi:hypothetical protein